MLLTICLLVLISCRNQTLFRIHHRCHSRHSNLDNHGLVNFSNGLHLRQLQQRCLLQLLSQPPLTQVSRRSQKLLLHVADIFARFAQLHQSTAASMWWCGHPDPIWVGSKWLLAFPRVPVTPGTPLHFFAMLPPE